MGLKQIGGEIRAQPLNDNFAYLDGKLLFGPESNRPNPGVAGRLYVTTDKRIIYEDTGTAWQQVGVSQQDFDAHQNRTVTQAGGVHGLEVESGTWTPYLAGEIVPGNHTYTVQEGSYFRIGRFVHIEFRLILSQKDGNMAGQVGIHGLPFITAKSHQNGGGVGFIAGISPAVTPVQINITCAHNRIEFRYNPSSGFLTPSDITNNFEIWASADYLTT